MEHCAEKVETGLNLRKDEAIVELSDDQMQDVVGGQETTPILDLFQSTTPILD